MTPISFRAKAKVHGGAYKAQCNQILLTSLNALSTALLFAWPITIIQVSSRFLQPAKHTPVSEDFQLLEPSCTVFLPAIYRAHFLRFFQFSSVQLLSHVRLFATPWIAACQDSLSIANSRSSPKLMYIESGMPSSHLILCRPLFLLPPIPPSIRVFSNESTLRMRWPKYWSFSFSISPSNEHPGLVSFRMDWLDLLAVQGTLKRLLQHHSSKASILRCSAFFTVQLSHYINSG